MLFGISNFQSRLHSRQPPLGFECVCAGRRDLWLLSAGETLPSLGAGGGAFRGYGCLHHLVVGLALRSIAGLGGVRPLGPPAGHLLYGGTLYRAARGAGLAVRKTCDALDDQRRPLVP